MIREMDAHGEAADLSKYSEELFTQFPSFRDRYKVVGTLGPNDEISVNALHSKFGKNIPAGWTIGTFSASDGRIIVAINDPSQSPRH